MLKNCSRCDQLKDVSEFTCASRNPDGFSYWCRDCHRSVNNARYHATKDARHAQRKEAYSPEKNAARRVRLMREQRGRVLVWNIKKRAEKKYLDYDLDDYIDEINARMYDPGVCELTGIPFNFTGTRDWDTPSVDRKEPDKGYVYSNIRLICFGMNVALNVWGEDALEIMVTAWLERRKSFPC